MYPVCFSPFAIRPAATIRPKYPATPAQRFSGGTIPQSVGINELPPKEALTSLSETSPSQADALYRLLRAWLLENNDQYGNRQLPVQTEVSRQYGLGTRVVFNVFSALSQPGGLLAKIPGRKAMRIIPRSEVTGALPDRFFRTGGFVSGRVPVAAFPNAQAFHARAEEIGKCRAAYELLRQAIIANAREWMNQRIPTSQELSQHWKNSRSVIEHAKQQLTLEGIITSAPGVGSKVTLSIPEMVRPLDDMDYWQVCDQTLNYLVNHHDNGQTVISQLALSRELDASYWKIGLVYRMLEHHGFLKKDLYASPIESPWQLVRPREELLAFRNHIHNLVTKDGGAAA